MSEQLQDLIREMKTSKVPHITVADWNAAYELLTNPTKIDQSTLKIETEAKGVTRVFSRHINRKELCEPYENPVGGFVESTADVSEMAYVSPLTAVLENVRVLEGAILMGQRVIKGNETIRPLPIPDYADVTA
jgi:hypothetical protein